MSSNANNLEISHLSGYMGVTEKIKRAMYDAAKQFVYIGFLLWEVQEYGYYREGGYKDVYDYAAQELNFKKSSVKNFIAISYQFGTADHRAINGAAHVRTMSLQQPYEKFQYSQLCEMLSMTEKQRELVKPDMTVKQIRELKKELKSEEPKAQPEPIQETPGQTSGLREPTPEEIAAENERLSKLYATEANIVEINGETAQVTHYIMEELCRLAGIKYIDYEDYEITIVMKE